MAPRPTPLFVYGTLLDDDCVLAVTGRVFQREPAFLPRHRRAWPRGGYPHLVADPDGTVHGSLLHGLDAEALAALDAYEETGRLYTRVEIRVMAGDVAVRSFVYRALRPRARRRRPASDG